MQLDAFTRNITKMCYTHIIYLIVNDSEDALTNKMKEEPVQNDKKKKRRILVAKLDVRVI
jgi:hypothetical protein